MMPLPFLILSIADENEREFMKCLYIEHAARMFRMAQAMTNSKQDAEDVVSEACVLLINKVSLLQTLEHHVLEGYIISTVKNAAFALHRKQKKQQKTNENANILLQDANDQDAPDEQILQQCMVNEIANAILQLSEEDQAAIRMKYFEQCSIREIADVLGIPEGNVRVRLNRVRKRLYHCLKEEST